jgi:hypothetical protein
LQPTGSEGVLGVFVQNGGPGTPCPTGAGLVFTYAPLTASTTDAEINTSSGVAGSPWQPLADVDCNTDEPAVGGGPSGLGLLETNDTTLGDYTVQYRRFTPPSTFGAPVVIASGSSGDGSLSQDGAGGIYATWDDDGLILGYSSTGGASWHVQSLVNVAASVGGLASSVNASGQGWAAYSTASGTEYAQPFDKADALPPPVPVVAPKSTAAPTTTGTAKAGKTLTCSTGKWSNTPTTYTYQWSDNGTAISGATGSTYTVTTLDEGTTLTCTVTASNTAGAASATSKGVKVPIPYVVRCPGATGKLSGSRLGLIKLGMTKTRAHYLYRHHSDRGKQYEDFFCLTPIGVRVGYGSPKLLSIIHKGARKRFLHRVVWASTSNPYYSLDRVRPGESITAAAAALHTTAPFHIGLNHWYLARKGSFTAVLKVRRNVVEEIGIADNALTKTRHAESVLMHSFY